MRSKKFRFPTLGTLGLLLIASSLSIVPVSSAANPDDGYPEGQAAPGRTCPNNDEGSKQVSAFSGKTLVCTLISGQKKWWIDGEPLPVAPPKPVEPAKNSGPAETSDDNMPPGFKHSYELPAKSIAKMKIIEDESYSAIDSKMRLDIYLPKGVVKPPLMIWVHGGGMVFGNENAVKYDESAKLLEVLIKNGIAVASVNYRLATEVPYPKTGQDVKTAIRYLRVNAAKYGFNPKKFAVGGDSAGGYLALMAAITGNQKTLFDDPAPGAPGIADKLAAPPESGFDPQPAIVNAAIIMAIFFIFGSPD
jgi:hypothetical protein